jgi:serine protease AprX
MRRLTLILAAVLLATLVPPAAAGDGVGAGLAGAEAPLAAPGPAKLDPAVVDAADRAVAGATLDLVVSLDGPAGERTRRALDQLGVWSWSFEHVPAAGVRLPVARLDELRALDGVLGVYLDEPLQYFLKDSATLLNTARAWEELGVTGEGVTVAILDTGVDFTHPDLAPAMRANVKLAGFGDPTPVVPLEGVANSDTSSGHGTHVAGDVAGRGTASGGVFRGIAPGAGLVGIGAGEGLSVFSVLEGFDWILKNRERYAIRAVNNSWGTQFKPFDLSDPVVLATRALVKAGVVVLFANGNDGDEMSMNPYAVPPWVLPVAAGSKKGDVAEFSSGGIEADTVGLGFTQVDVAGETRQPLQMGLYHPAVTTPGEEVVSTRSNTTITPITALPSDLSGEIPAGQLPYYTTLSGTSMASPEAAGLVALVLEAAPELTPAQVRMVLQITARFLPGVPFFRQGYGYADATAAVELAQSLHGRPAPEIQRDLDQRQTERDRAVLDTLAHPSRTYAWNEEGPVLAGSLVHEVDVPAGTERVKVVTNGGTVPFTGFSTYDITVTDAAGRQVGTVSASEASGTTVLDLDLRKLDPDAAEAARRFDDLSFGLWTVEVRATGSLVLPRIHPFVDDSLTKRLVATLVSIFGPQSAPCRAATEFVPQGSSVYRFQDDDATGVPHAANPDYTYVGPVPDGSLGRRPERRLAGTFGSLTTARPPVFSTAPLSEPLTVGGAGTVETWVQGPGGEAVSGLLVAQLLDIPPEGDPAVIGETPPDTGVVAGTLEPLRTQAPLLLRGPHTIPPGHRLGLSLAQTFIGTSGHTLYYDSDQYPSGLTVTTGATVPAKGCPA